MGKQLKPNRFLKGSLLSCLVCYFFLAAFCLSPAVAKDLHFKNQINKTANNVKKSKSFSGAYFAIQFSENYKYGFKKIILSTGAEFINYIPEDAVLVKATQSQLKEIRKVFGTKLAKIVAYAPELRVSANVPVVSVFNEKKTESFVLTALTKKDVPALVDKLQKLGIKAYAGTGRNIGFSTELKHIYVIAKLDGVEWLSLTPSVQSFAMDFSADKNFKSSDPVTPPEPNGDYSDLTGFESGVLLMDLESAYKNNFTGKGEIVVVADTGLDTGKISTLRKDFVNVIGGQAFGPFSNTWEDPNGHGTHVSGSVGGTGAESKGIIHGTAWGARLYAQGMWSSALGGLFPPTKLDDLYIPAYRAGARIHTNSWGTVKDLGAYDSLAAITDEFVWENPDMLLLFAAGNSGQDMNYDGKVDEDSVSSPGTAKNVLTVGASENMVSHLGIQREHILLKEGDVKWSVEPLASDTLSNNPNGIAVFSSRGPTDDKRLKPELVAPGTNILSLRSQHEEASTLWGAYNPVYAFCGGTSMSTPLVAGAAAVVRQFLKEEKSISNPSAAILKATLMSAAKDLFPGQYEPGETQELPTKRPNVHEGFGRVNIHNIVSESADDIFIDDEIGVQQDEKKLVAEFTLDKDLEMNVLMLFSDAPSLSSASKSLVNDLDVIIEHEDGSSFSGTDRINNFEFFEGIFPAGSYKVFVVGHRIVRSQSDGLQPFALVVNR